MGKKEKGEVIYIHKIIYINYTNYCILIRDWMINTYIHAYMYVNMYIEAKVQALTPKSLSKYVWMYREREREMDFGYVTPFSIKSIID